MHKLQGDGGCFHGLKHLRTVPFDLRTSLQCKSGVLHSGHRRRCQRCQSVQGEQRQTAVGGRARQRGRQGEHFSGMPSSVVRLREGCPRSLASPPLLLSTKSAENEMHRECMGQNGLRSPKNQSGKRTHRKFNLWAQSGLTFFNAFQNHEMCK